METPALFQNDVKRQILRETIGYESKRQDARYTDDIDITTARLNTVMAAIKRCLFEGEMRGQHRQRSTVPRMRLQW